MPIISVAAMPMLTQVVVLSTRKDLFFLEIAFVTSGSMAAQISPACGAADAL
jgi:hypothetical protein